MKWYSDFGGLRLTHRTGFTRITARDSFVLVMANLIPSAFALSLGGEQVTSTLGQPLRVVIPLLNSTTDPIENRCFRIVTPARSDGFPVITQARIELQTSTNPPQLIIRSDRSIDDPVVRISIEAGCEASIRSDYTILLDPAPGQLTDTRPMLVTPSQSVAFADERSPVTAKQPALSATNKATTTAEGAAAQRAKNALAVDRDRSRSAKLNQTQLRTLASPVITTVNAKQLEKSQLEVQRGTLANVTTRAAGASLAALAIPSLRIDSDLSFREPNGQPGAAPVDELQAAIIKDRRARLIAAPIESDLAPGLEADLVAAQRRLSELQSQLSSAAIVAKNGAPADPSGATNSKAASTAVASTTKASWDWRNWIWIPGLLLVIGLIAFLLRQRRTQPPPQLAVAKVDDTRVTHDKITAARADRPRNDIKNRPNTTLLNEQALSPALAAVAASGAALALSANPTYGSEKPKPIIATHDEREATDRLNNPLFELRDTESHVDVSELSQITDEAQVYADLGHNDQAIALLREHIKTQTSETVSPAPWLMIFELYQRTNNRQGYDELAPQFREHFNGHVPDWENYGHELVRDNGLEAFPQLIASIERDWGTDDARKLLEALLYDNRGGSQLNFSLSTYRDILLLLQVHDGFTAQLNVASNAIDRKSRNANDKGAAPKQSLSLELIDPPKSGEYESFFKTPPAHKY